MSKDFKQVYYLTTKQEVFEKTYNLEELKEFCNTAKKTYPYQDTETQLLDDEQWKSYPYLESILCQYNPKHYIGKEYHKINSLEISNRGRVKVIYKQELDLKDEILRQTDDIESGYLRLSKYPGFGNVYRLVADTWLKKIDKNKNIVHHIDNDGYNNNVKNLIWVDNIEHGQIHGF